ncbi:MAG TPA: phage holin family protein [Burkholderiaceae bacterium]|nr:phage holin family protein [Burkholderiaceae bacterium]
MGSWLPGVDTRTRVIERHAQPSLIHSLRQLAISSLSYLRSRVELVALELAHEKSRLTALLVTAVMALLFTALTLVFGAFGVVAYYWDSVYRVQAIYWVTAFFTLAAAICWLVLRAKLRTKSMMFDSSLTELRKDQEALERSDE